jgi:hypothetical protein
MEQKRQKGGTIAGALGAGFVSGMFSTAVLNPYDRALFLAVSNSRPFMCAANFRSPFAGLSQTLFSRSVSTGLWFPLEDLSHRLLRDRVGLRGGTLENAISGQMAGAANAALLNPLAVVKFRTWGLPDHERDILRAARDIYRHGGALAFTRGMKATMARDMVFGMIYSSLKRYTSSKQSTPTAWRRSREFAVNAASAAVATVVSGPFNYVRNVQFAKVRPAGVAPRAPREPDTP